MPRKGKRGRAAQQREKKRNERKQLQCGDVETHATANQDVVIKTVTSGSLHQGSTIFEYPGVQCTFISFYALICMHEKPPKLWTGNDIDSCVIDGNYRFVKHCADNQMDPQMLLARELPQRVSYDDKTFICLQTENAIKVGTLGIKAIAGASIMTSLDDALEQTFCDFDACLFLCGGMTIALAKHESAFYVFDPHSRDQYGVQHPEGNAVLVTCKNICDTIQFLNKLFTQSLRLSSSEQFELVPVSILKENETASPVIVNGDTPDINQYNETSNKILQTKDQSSNSSTEPATDETFHKQKSDLNVEPNETLKTYFADQQERDKAHKQRKRRTEAELFDSTIKRRKYMKHYMQKTRKCDSYRSEEKCKNRKRMANLRITQESKDKTMIHIHENRSSIEQKTKNREATAIRMRNIRSTSEGKRKNRLTATIGMKRIRSTSEGKSKNRKSAAKGMKQLRSSSPEKMRNKEMAKNGMNKLLSNREGKVKHNKSSAKTMKNLRKRKDYIELEYAQNKKKENGRLVFRRGL